MYVCKEWFIKSVFHIGDSGLSEIMHLVSMTRKALKCIGGLLAVNGCLTVDTIVTAVNVLDITGHMFVVAVH